MNYDRSILDRVLKDTENKKIKIEAEAELSKRKLYEKLPELSEVDAALRTSVLDVIRASFGSVSDNEGLISAARKKNLALQARRAEILKENGLPDTFGEPQYNCRICNDTGYLSGELCSCIKERYRLEKAREINSDLRLPDYSFSDFDLSLYPDSSGGGLTARAQMSEVFDFCSSYAESFSPSAESLFMSGKSGLGKTHLAAAIAKTVSDNGFSVVFDSAFNILGKCEDVKFGRSAEDISRFNECDLLIIDDVGCEMATPFAVAAFHNLISERSLSKKASVVISTLSAEELRRRYGPSLVSRLEGDFVKLEFLGNDVRKLH